MLRRPKVSASHPSRQPESGLGRPEPKRQADSSVGMRTPLQRGGEGHRGGSGDRAAERVNFGHLDQHDIYRALATAGSGVLDVVIVWGGNGVVSLHGQAPTVKQLNQIELEISRVPEVDEVLSWLHLTGEWEPTTALSMRATHVLPLAVES